MAKLTTLQAYKNTTVSVSQSREHIEQLLDKWGCEARRWESIGQVESLSFILPREDGGQVAVRIKIPIREDTSRAQMMRVLHWYIKTKLEAVEVGMAELEEEFLPLMLVGQGKTAYEALKPQIAAASTSGSPLALLPGAEVVE